MPGLTIGVCGKSRKENEYRLPIHPAHFNRIDGAARAQIFLEEGYGERFGSTREELEPLVGGIRSRSQLIQECDVILLPKPVEEDLAELREGQVLWGWPHCVQQEGITQLAIARRLTLIAWESMNHWSEDGPFQLHVFNMNNELAGYCSVLQAMELIGVTGEYGRGLKSAVISFGATGRGAVKALSALGVSDVTVLTHRSVAQVDPSEAFEVVHYERSEDGDQSVVAVTDAGPVPIAELLAQHDVVVNCVRQDPAAPQMFVRTDQLDPFRRGSLIVDVSCDDGMAFDWARSTTFEDPMFIVGEGVHYYAVDHSPSFLWDSTTWEISDALLPYLRTVMGGPEAWDADATVHRAVEIRDGVIQNPQIISFQGRSPEFPHEKI